MIRGALPSPGQVACTAGVVAGGATIGGGVGAVGLGAVGLIAGAPTGPGAAVTASGGAAAGAEFGASVGAGIGALAAPILCSSAGGGGGGSGRSTAGNMQKQVERGQAPRDVERVDRARAPFEKDHIALKDGRSLNWDGTWKHGAGSITRAVADWLVRNGWTPPPGS